MRRKIQIPPPSNYTSFGPSELFRFFFQIGRWTEGSFSDELQAYTRGTLVSTVTISKWKNRDVIPTRYSGPLFKMIENLSEPEIAKDWVAAFETVWAFHTSGRQPPRKIHEGNYSDAICTRHKRWITELYTEPEDGKKFSAADLYVPLQFYETLIGKTKIHDVDDVMNPTSKSWTFISGVPGSGKSMSALHMAASLCERDVFPIYIRGRRLSNINIDVTREHQSIGDSFSIESFVKHFRASSFQTAYLILDGLDEIDQLARETAASLRKILLGLKAEQAACTAHHKTLHIILLGPESDIAFAANQVETDHSRHFSLLRLDGSVQSHDTASHHILGQDLRPIWWQKYLAAEHRVIDPNLPDFLTVEYDDFLEFSSSPHLSHLICQTALGPLQDKLASQLPHEHVNEFTFSSNKNEIYKFVFEQFASNVKSILTRDSFLSVLQYIAMKTWQSGDGHSISLTSIFGSLNDPVLRAAFETLGLSPGAHMTTDIFTASFYVRLTAQESHSSNVSIEFTHRAFVEYLVSALIFDRFIDLISAFETQQNMTAALKAWVEVSHAGSRDPSLAGFCQNEAALRFDKLSYSNWDTALTIIQDHLSAQHIDGMGLESLTQYQHANGLLFFIWSCLNLERQKREGTYFTLTENKFNFDGNNLKKIQHSSFLSFALSGLHFSGAGLSHLKFNLGHMEHAIFEDTRFAMTHWRDVKVSATRFIRSTFEQSSFYEWRVDQSSFNNCFFQGTRVQGAIFSDCQLNEVSFSQCHFSDVEFIATGFKTVIFDRCVFSKSSFSEKREPKSIIQPTFRHCTFLDMDAAVNKIPAENMKGRIPQNYD